MSKKNQRKFHLDRSSFKPLLEASHTKGLNGRKVTPNNPSEWCWAWAALQFPIGTPVTKEEFRVMLITAVHYEVLSKMIDENEAFMVLNDNLELAFEFRK